MTKLRQQMIDAMILRGLAPSTQRTYLQAVTQLARHYRRSPDRLSKHEVKAYLLHLHGEAQRSTSTCNVVAAALRFLYHETLGRSAAGYRIPFARRPKKLPQVLSREEVARLLSCARFRRHRVLFGIAYAAALRVSEIVRLRPSDIDADRMVIRVAQGKGAKDRLALLPPRLLEELRAYWRREQPREYLFPSPIRPGPLCAAALKHAFGRAKQRAQILGPAPPSPSAAGAREPHELGEIVRQHGERYVTTHGATPAQQAVLHALARCRTAALGGPLEACDRCGHRRAVYHSCRNRHCPKCQTLAAAEGLEARRADLLPVEYFHVVFTLPHALCPLALHRPRVVYDLLFRAATETLAAFGRDPRYFAGDSGGTLGITAILHTWGQNLSLHPHLHCVVTGGGLSADAQRFVRPRHKGFLFPVRALAKVFRGKFLEGLQRAFEAGKLGEEDSTPRLCETLRRVDWVVYAKPPFAGPERVLAYLGRYTHRIAISTPRILGLEEGHVTFRYRDYADGNRQKVLRLDALEFLRRFLLHVLPKGFVRIRHYGLLANRHRQTKIARCRALLAAPIPEPRRPESPSEKILRLAGQDVLRCPVCHEGRMIQVAEIPRPPRRFHPPIRAPARRAA